MITVLLSVPSATSTGFTSTGTARSSPKVLVHHHSTTEFSDRGDDGERLTRITPAPRYIILETHTLSYSPSNATGSGTPELPQVYKQAISLFRSIYTLLRVLPSAKLQRRLKRGAARGGGGSAGNLGIELRVTAGDSKALDDESVVAGFGECTSSSLA